MLFKQISGMMGIGDWFDQLGCLARPLHHNSAHVVDGALVVDVDAHAQESLVLATAHGQQLVRRNALEGA